MADLVRFEVREGEHVLVEGAGEPLEGFERVGRSERLVGTAATTLLAALTPISQAMSAVLDGLTTAPPDQPRPSTAEVEFGVQLDAEVGAYFVKNKGEAHLVVKLTWAL
jgi:hypothetical protein